MVDGPQRGVYRPQNRVKGVSRDGLCAAQAHGDSAGADRVGSSRVVSGGVGLVPSGVIPMSDTTTRTAAIEDRAQTIAAAFAESEDDALEAVDADTLVDYFDQLLAFDVPLDEAERSVVRRVLDEADVVPETLPEEIATLGGFSSGPSGFSRTLVGEVDQGDEWVDVRVEVVDLWEPHSETIAQVGLVGDESGTIKFVNWASGDLPRLEEGESYRIESAVTDEYEGRFSITLNSATQISSAEEPVAGTAAHKGAIVAVQPGSG